LEGGIIRTICDWNNFKPYTCYFVIFCLVAKPYAIAQDQQRETQGANGNLKISEMVQFIPLSSMRKKEKRKPPTGI
jgi:hypothetical protein